MNSAKRVETKSDGKRFLPVQPGVGTKRSSFLYRGIAIQPSQSSDDARSREIYHMMRDIALRTHVVEG